MRPLRLFSSAWGQSYFSANWRDAEVPKVYWPGMVGEHEVRLRKSAIKFDSNLSDLNVVRVSSYS